MHASSVYGYFPVHARKSRHCLCYVHLYAAQVQCCSIKMASGLLQTVNYSKDIEQDAMMFGADRRPSFNLSVQLSVLPHLLPWLPTPKCHPRPTLSSVARPSFVDCWRAIMSRPRPPHPVGIASSTPECDPQKLGHGLDKAPCRPVLRTTGHLRLCVWLPCLSLSIVQGRELGLPV